MSYWTGVKGRAFWSLVTGLVVGVGFGSTYDWISRLAVGGGTAPGSLLLPTKQSEAGDDSESHRTVPQAALGVTRRQPRLTGTRPGGHTRRSLLALIPSASAVR
jgi:hypothetical protein